MKWALLIIVFAIGAWALFRSHAEARSGNNSAMMNKPSDPKDVYLGLRSLALQGSRAKFNLPATAKPNQPWGVLMDWGVRNGTATVLAMSDGSASVYLSGGGGYLGGIGQDPIRNAAKRAIEAAGSAQLPAQSTSKYPLSELHEVFFYFLTDVGVYTIRTSEQEINSPTHPLRNLGDATQGVITQYRLWYEARAGTQQ